jgi:hypothetical protein
VRNQHRFYGPDGLLHALDGGLEVTLLTDSDSDRGTLRAASLLVVP